MSCVFEKSNSNNLWCESRWICSFGLMPTCNPVRKYTVLQCWPRILSNSMSQMFCWDALHTSQARSEEVWLPKTTYLACHHLLSTAIGLPIHGDWDSGTRCVQVTKKHVALSLASNTNLPNMTLLVLWLVNSWWNFGSTIGRPMLGLDLQTFDIAMRLFLSCAQWWALVVWHCSQHVNSFVFWLRLWWRANEHLNVVFRLITSVRLGCCNGKIQIQMPNTIISSSPLSSGWKFSLRCLWSVGEYQHTLQNCSNSNSLFQTTRPISHDATVNQDACADVCPQWPSSSQLHCPHR